MHSETKVVKRWYSRSNGADNHNVFKKVGSAAFCATSRGRRPQGHGEREEREERAGKESKGCRGGKRQGSNSQRWMTMPGP